MSKMFVGRRPAEVVYQTSKGRMFKGLSEEILSKPYMKRFEGKVDLIFTSPPFPLNRKKKYGNLQGEEYITGYQDLALYSKKCSEIQVLL